MLNRTGKISYFAVEDPFLTERLTSARSSVYLSALPVLWVSFLQLVARPCSAHRFIIGKSWDHVGGQNKRLYPHCSESPIYQQQKGKWESYSVFIVSLVGKLIKRVKEANSLSRKKSIRSHHLDSVKLTGGLLEVCRLRRQWKWGNPLLGQQWWPPTCAHYKWIEIVGTINSSKWY